MFIRTYLTDKTSRNSHESFKIMDMKGQIVGYFTVPHYLLTMDRIKSNAKFRLGVSFKTKCEFEPLDEYSPNLVMIVYNEGRLNKFIIFK